MPDEEHNWSEGAPQYIRPLALVLVRRDDGAIRFCLVPAIGEAAPECQLFDVEENLSEGLRPGPKLDLSQAGRVDDEATARDL